VSDAEPDEPTRYEIALGDLASDERDRAYLDWLGRDPDFAPLWLEGLSRALNGLNEVPGPRAHAIDEEASLLFGREVRRLLYRGPKGCRTRLVHRVYYALFEPAHTGEEGVIRVLRILPGARPLVPRPDAAEET
jgi:hypothetical protein